MSEARTGKDGSRELETSSGKEERFPKELGGDGKTWTLAKLWEKLRVW